MKRNWFTMDSVRESNLWQNGVFVFDTSSIGALYGLIPSSQHVMMDIINKFANRTWIPAQVIYEYLKNREKMIINPCEEYYQYPKEITNSNLISTFDTYLKEFENEDFHPKMSDKALDTLKELRNRLDNILRDVKKIIKDEHSKQRERITKVKEEDKILNAINNLPQGVPFVISDVLEIIKEGELRYRNSIPPGYMDCKTKKGTQIYGDLIIWKEVLNFAKNKKKDIIFVCDDVKEDWYISDEKKKQFTPRHELLKEFIDVTGQDCWIYPLRNFIENLEKYNKDNEILPLFQGINAIKASLENRERRQKSKLTSDNELVVICDECEQMFDVDLSELGWDWECIEGNERSMGLENHYTSEDDIECPHCGNDIHLTFNFWEYPEGAYNNSDIEIDGGDIDSNVDFEDYMPPLFGVEEDVCFKCGRYGAVGNEGLCSECLEEQERILTSDD